MKNKLLKILGISVFSFTMLLSSVNASTVEEINEDNSIGISVTPEQLEKAKNLDGTTLLGYDSKNIAITTVSDFSGNIIATYEKELTPFEEKIVENNKNVHVLADGKLHDFSKELQLNDSHYHKYETNSKYEEIYYFQYTGSGNYAIDMRNTWKTNPTVHSYDIIATRWDVNKSTSDYFITGEQTTMNVNISQDYTDSSNNLNKFSNGTGLSQNLFDDVAPLYERLVVQSPTNFGTYVYGSYQHANREVSLATSKAYTISASGLGGVINQQYPSYYDGMQGVYVDSCYLAGC